MFLSIRNFLLIAVFFCLGFIAHAEVAVPSLNARVTDLTGTLSTVQIENLEQKLAALEQEKGSQVAVLIVSTTTPEDIAEYSIRVVEKWKLGRKGVDDGVLLLIAKADRRMRIEVGYGLEGAITDLSAGRIIREFIAPELRQGRFYEGVVAGTDKIAGLIKGEPLPEPTTRQGSKDKGAPFVMLIFVSSFLAPLLASMLGRILAVSAITIGGGVIMWLSSHDPFLTGFVALFLAVVSAAFSAPRSSSYRDGGGFGGGFGGGGGFSGGGGGFGGGGASGGW